MAVEIARFANVAVSAIVPPIISHMISSCLTTGLRSAGFL
jgi:hypothetical protein